MRRCSIFLHEFKSVALRRHAGAGPAGVKQAGGIAKKKTEGSIPVRSAADQTAREIIASLAGVSKHRFENEEQRATVVTLMGALASDRKAALLEQSELAELTIIAFGLGMYRELLDIYHARSVSNKGHKTFALSSKLVDAAYKLDSVDEMLKLADLVSEHLSILPHDIVGDVGFSRILWRLECMSVDRLHSGKLSERPDADIRNAMHTIWTQYLPRFSPTILGTFEEYRLQLRRAVLYSYDSDKGEMASVQLSCKMQIIATAAHKDGTENELPSDRRATFYLALVRSCREGSWVDKAEEYYDAFARGNSDVSERMLLTYLSVLANAKAFKKIVRFGSTLLQQNTDAQGILHVTPRVAVTIAENATEQQEVSVVEAAYRGILAAKLSSETTMQISQFHIFQLLNNLARCASPMFHEQLAMCVDKNLIDGSIDTVTFLSLQYAFATADALEAVESAIATLAEHNTNPSERITSLILATYSRWESPKFLSAFRDAESRGLFRQNWMELLVRWADRRQYVLTDDERRYIIRFVRDRYQTDFHRSIISQLEIHLAKSEGNDNSAPTAMDPRTVFLRKEHTVEVPPHPRLFVCGITSDELEASFSSESTPIERFFRRYVLEVLRDTQQGSVNSS